MTLRTRTRRMRWHPTNFIRRTSAADRMTCRYLTFEPIRYWTGSFERSGFRFGWPGSRRSRTLLDAWVRETHAVGGTKVVLLVDRSKSDGRRRVDCAKSANTHARDDIRGRVDGGWARPRSTPSRAAPP